MSHADFSVENDKISNAFKDHAKALVALDLFSRKKFKLTYNMFWIPYSESFVMQIIQKLWKWYFRLTKKHENRS